MNQFISPPEEAIIWTDDANLRKHASLISPGILKAWFVVRQHSLNLRRQSVPGQSSA